MTYNSKGVSSLHSLYLKFGEAMISILQSVVSLVLPSCTLVLNFGSHSLGYAVHLCARGLEYHGVMELVHAANVTMILML